MVTTSMSSNGGGPRKFVMKPQAVDTAVMKDHGAQLVETRVVYEMRLRFWYYILNRANDMVNIVTWHKNTMATMFKVDPTIKIVPNDPSMPPYNDVRLFPSDKASFERQFTELSELVGNRSQ
jgi:hypothetical protein